MPSPTLLHPVPPAAFTSVHLADLTRSASGSSGGPGGGLIGTPLGVDQIFQHYMAANGAQQVAGVTSPAAMAHQLRFAAAVSASAAAGGGGGGGGGQQRQQAMAPMGPQGGMSPRQMLNSAGAALMFPPVKGVFCCFILICIKEGVFFTFWTFVLIYLYFMIMKNIE